MEIKLTSGFTIQLMPSGTVEVLLDAETALKVIGKEMGLYSAYEDESDTRVVLGGTPEHPALEVQENISYHSSPCWNTIKILSTDKEQIDRYLLFRHLVENLKNGNVASGKL